MKILVCGSRDFTDAVLMSEVLELEPEDIVIHGDASGADRIAGRLGVAAKATVQAFPAKWREKGVYNPRAGFERNSRMLEEKPDVVIAFFSGKRTNGTMDTVNKAKKLGIPVLEFGLD